MTRAAPSAVAAGDTLPAEGEWPEHGAWTVVSDGVPVSVIKRHGRIDVDDQGWAVAAAGRPAGWLPVAVEVVEAHAVNVNRRGVVFVPAVAGRDIDRLVTLVARASRALRDVLLDADADADAAGR